MDPYFKELELDFCLSVCLGGGGGGVTQFSRNNVRRHYLVVVEERKTTRAPDNNPSTWQQPARCQDDNTRNMLVEPVAFRRTDYRGKPEAADRNMVLIYC